MTVQTKTQMREKFIALGGKFDGTDWIVWKYVTSGNNSPNNWGTVHYVVGKTILDAVKVNKNTYASCAEGLNVHAAQPSKMHFAGYSTMHLLECRVKTVDVGCVPSAAHRWEKNHSYSQGPKFRVQRLTVVASYEFDDKDPSGLNPLKMARGYEFA